MKTQYLPIFRKIAELETGKRFAGFHGTGIDLYPRGDFRRPHAKVKIEVNWGSFGSMDPRQAKVFKKNLSEAISIAKKLSYKLTEDEFRELKNYAHDEIWGRKMPKPEALGGVF